MSRVLGLLKSMKFHSSATCGIEQAGFCQGHSTLAFVLVLVLFSVLASPSRLHAQEFPGAHLSPQHREVYASNLTNYIEAGRVALRTENGLLQTRLAEFQKSFAQDESLSRQMTRDVVDLSLRMLILDIRKFNWEFSLAPTAEYAASGTRPSDEKRRQELKKLEAQQAEFLQNPLTRLLAVPVYKAMTSRGRGVFLYPNMPSYFLYHLFASQTILEFQAKELRKLVPSPFLSRERRNGGNGNINGVEKLAAFLNLGQWSRDDSSDSSFKKLASDLITVVPELESVRRFEGSSAKEKVLANGKNSLSSFFATYAEQLRVAGKYLELKPLQYANAKEKAAASGVNGLLYSFNLDFFRHYSFLHHFPSVADLFSGQSAGGQVRLPLFQVNQLRSDLLQFDLEDQAERASTFVANSFYGAGFASIFIPGGGVASPVLFGLGALANTVNGVVNNNWSEAQLSLFAAASDPLGLGAFSGADVNSAQAQLLNRGVIRQTAKRNLSLMAALEVPLFLGSSFRFLKNLSTLDLAKWATAKPVSNSVAAQIAAETNETAKLAGSQYLKTVSSAFSVKTSSMLLGILVGWQVWDDYKSSGSGAAARPTVKNPTEAMDTKKTLEDLVASAKASAKNLRDQPNSDLAMKLRRDLQAVSKIFADTDLRLQLTIMRDYYKAQSSFGESNWFQLHSGDNLRVIFGKVFYPAARYQRLLTDLSQDSQARARLLAGEISEAVLVQSVFQTDAIGAATQLALIQFSQTLLDSNTPVTDTKISFYRNKLHLFIGEKLAFTTSLALDLPQIQKEALIFSQIYSGNQAGNQTGDLYQTIGHRNSVPNTNGRSNETLRKVTFQRPASQIGQRANLDVEAIPQAEGQEKASTAESKQAAGATKRQRITPLDREFWTLNPFSAQNPIVPGGVPLFATSRIGQVYLPDAAVTVLKPAYELSAKVLQSPLLNRLSGVAPEFIAHAAWRLGCDQGYLMHKEVRENNYKSLSEYLFGESRAVGLSGLESKLKGIESTDNPLLAHKLNQSITPMALLMFAAGQTIGQRYFGEIVRKGLGKLPYFERKFGPRVSSVLYDQYGWPMVGAEQSYATVIGKVSGILVGTGLGWSFNDIGWQAANWGKLSAEPLAEVMPYFGAENFGTIDRGWGLLGYTIGGFVGHNLGYSLVTTGLNRFQVASRVMLSERVKMIGAHAGALSMNVALGMSLTTYFPQFAKFIFDKFDQKVLPLIAADGASSPMSAEELMERSLEGIFNHLIQAHRSALASTNAHLERNSHGYSVNKTGDDKLTAEEQALKKFSQTMRPVFREFVKSLAAQMRTQLLEFTTQLKSVQALSDLKEMTYRELDALIPSEVVEDKAKTIELIQATFTDPSRIETYKKNFFSLIQELYPTMYRIRFAQLMTQLTGSINLESDPLLSSLLDLRELVRIQILHLQVIAPARATTIAQRLHQLHVDMVQNDLAFYKTNSDILERYQKNLLEISQEINSLLAASRKSPRSFPGSKSE